MIRKYEKYKNSGVEWFGKIPEGWGAIRLKWISMIISKGTTPSTIGREIQPVGDIRFVKAENVSNNTVVAEPINFIDQKTNGMLIRSQLQESDILFVIAGATIGKVAILPKMFCPANTNQAISFIRLKSKDNVLFVWYWLQSHYINKILWLDAVQSAQPNLSMEKLGNFYVPLPSPLEQTAIAKFLDSKTAEIDQLIANKEKLIALYEEEKTTIINNAVTKGVDPKVKTQPSGIEWLGDIPAHWEVKRLKYLVSKVGSGVTPKGGANVYQLDGIPLLRSQNIHFKELRLEDVAYISQEIHDDMENSKVLSGDVLLNITGASIGRCYYVDNSLGEANVNQHVCIIRPKTVMMTKYLYYLLRSDVGQRQIDIEQTGSGREGLNFESLKNFLSLLTKHSEQTTIVAHIETECSRLDSIIDKFKKQIDLFKEYRTTLISEVVTGKIDVRDEETA